MDNDIITTIQNRAIPPILQELQSVYKLWQGMLPNIVKTSRYTLGEKVDNYFLETMEAIFIASFLAKEQKLPYLQKAVGKLDLLKFFLQTTWEIKALDNQKYIMLSEPLERIGKQLGGWMKQITSTPGVSRAGR
jgi:hypothetical protein